MTVLSRASPWQIVYRVMLPGGEIKWIRDQGRGHLRGKTARRFISKA